MYTVLFDGVCNLCNGAVNWLIDRDKKNLFRFASLQSAYGQQATQQYGLNHEYLNTIVLIENNRAYLRAEAVLRILKHLGGIYKAAYIFIILPAPLLNFFYNLVARYRYKIFGKRESCRVPEPWLKDKFIA